MTRVVLVTGASRGVGRGIALGLAPDSVVYVTGRPAAAKAGAAGDLTSVAAEIDARGGRGVAVVCDHADDSQTAELLTRIADEQGGRLDVLVNNATALPPPAGAAPFWERPLEAELSPLTVGARSHYVTLHHAAPIMAAQGHGLVVNVSSPGSRTLVTGLHGITYGMDKAAIDKMTFDTAHELKPHGVGVVSLWPGIVMTEFLESLREVAADFLAHFAPGYESPELLGRVIDALSRDVDLLSRSGRAWYAAQLAQELGVTEPDGSIPPLLADWMGQPLQYAVAPATWAEFRRDATS